MESVKEICLEVPMLAGCIVIFMILGAVWGFYICTQIENKFINKNINKNGNKK